MAQKAFMGRTALFFFASPAPNLGFGSLFTLIFCILETASLA